jgi:hypothetical protein
MDLKITKRENTNEVVGLLSTTILLAPHQVEVLKIALPEFDREWRLDGIAVVREDEVWLPAHQTIGEMVSMLKQQQNKLIESFWEQYDNIERMVKLVKKVLANQGAGK